MGSAYQRFSLEASPRYLLRHHRLPMNSQDCCKSWTSELYHRVKDTCVISRLIENDVDHTFIERFGHSPAEVVEARNPNRGWTSAMRLVVSDRLRERRAAAIS